MQALNKFIAKEQNDDIIAILLVGSYAVGNNNKYSDIDVYFIEKDNVKYRKRGNILIDGYLIEYFFNPLYKVKEYLKKDHRGHGGAMANMLINGKVIYDKNHIIPKLKRQAAYYYRKQHPQDDMKYYAAWCAYDEYLAAEYHNDLAYYLALKYLIEAYLYNNNYIVPPDIKLEKFFKNPEYRRKYRILKFPNNEFNQLVINCFDNKNDNNLKKLYNYVLKDGNFDINNFIHIEKIK